MYEELAVAGGAGNGVCTTAVELSLQGLEVNNVQITRICL